MRSHLNLTLKNEEEDTAWMRIRKAIRRGGNRVSKRGSWGEGERGNEGKVADSAHARQRSLDLFGRQR